MTQNRQLITATRQELSYTLNLKEGTMPDDWSGHVFINSPAGTVNSGGLPYPANSREQGSPIMNGDGYVYRFDLGASGVQVKTALMKPPCYYADEATKIGNPNGYNELYAFHNCGLSRLSPLLGARNELNTAVTPVRFEGDDYPRMMACYDAGRPWEINPLSLEMVTAIGQNSEYVFATPEKLFPLPVIETTAHPIFDPYTREFFVVNFYHSIMQKNVYESALHILQLRTTMYFCSVTPAKAVRSTNGRYSTKPVHQSISGSACIRSLSQKTTSCWRMPHSRYLSI